MTIRLMQTADLAAVADIEKRSNFQPWTYDDFEESLAREDGTTLLLVSTDDIDGTGAERVTGYAVLYMASGEGEIMTIAVEPGARRRGTGKALISALPEFASDAGISLTEINLEVRESNQPAISLYEAMGFEKAGRRPGFYSAPKEDAVLMKKTV